MSKLIFKTQRIGEVIKPINEKPLSEYKLQITHSFSQEQIDELSALNGYILISIGADGNPVTYVVIG